VSRGGIVVSFVIAAPEIVTAAAGNLAGIGSTVEEATAAAAVHTTSVAAAAADDVSIAISQLFGTYGRRFQALSAQAAAFHHEFVSLLNGGAAAYCETEVANSAGVAAATDPILGGLGPILGGGTGGGILGGVGPVLGGALSFQLSGFEVSLLPGLFAAGATASAAGEPWQMLFANTGANLHTIFSNFAAHPFPVLQQVILNQNGYANTFGAGVGSALQNFPSTLANVPANVQLGITGASTFGPSIQAFINQQNSYSQMTSAALQRFGADLQKTLPVFEYDMGMAGQALTTGDFHGAVQDIPRAVVHLLLSGVDITNLSDVKVQGPAGDLLPITSIAAEEEQSLVNLLPPGSIPEQIAQNFVNTISTSALPLGFAVIGPPIATLNGIATGATAFGAALQTGNGVAAVGALADMPAYALNGFLNGETIVDVTIPVTETVDIPAMPPLPAISVGPDTPVVVHLPFDGILTPPQPITATVDVSALVYPVPFINVTFGGTQFGGLLPELLNYIPEQIASAISHS
jgi:hypothetical protein